MKSLAQDISQELSAAVASASTEVAIIREFVGRLSNLRMPPNINIKTGFCHQKPYAFFVKPVQYAQRGGCELGDILWVYKLLSHGTVADHRAIFSQAKYSKSPKYKIEPHQYCFLLHINTNSFRFGNSITQNAGYQPMIFTAITRSRHFSNYLFLGPGSTPKCECTNELVLATPTSINTAPIQAFEQYINSFFKRQSFGMDILRNTSGRELVDIVFKRLGLVLDPPEEWEDCFENSESGFGVISVTVLEE